MHQSNQRMSDPKIRSEKIRVGSEFNTIEKRVIDSFHSEKVVKIDKSWLQEIINGHADEKSARLFLKVIDNYIEAKSKELTSYSIKTHRKVRNKVKKIEDYYGKTYFIDQIDRTFFD